MILALLTTALAFVVGLVYLATAGTTVATSRVFANHAQARQIAESGMAIAASYIEHNPSWRGTQPQGFWIQGHSMLGGTLDLKASFAPGISMSGLAPKDPSFEMQTTSLGTPLLSPPMSGVIGGWNVQRTATVVTGPTVPRIGAQATTHATLGANAGYISFGLSISGSGTFAQTLTQSLQPKTRYELSVDITVSTALSLSFTRSISVKAGGTLLASSTNASSLTLPALPGALPQPPTNPTTPNDLYESVLTLVGVGPGSPSTHTLSFVTDGAPPAGNISIELSSKASGLAASIWFDNVRFVAYQNDPVTLTATGTCGAASHVVQAQVMLASDGAATFIDWKEP